VIRYALAALALAALIGAAIWWYRAAQTPPQVALHYVGSDACAGCHAAEHAAWQTSQHRAAMQPASAETVLGDFRDASFTEGGVTSTFFVREAKPFVRTDGPDGKLADFAVAYTFGIAPLQQYLVELPGGRLQALGLAWDARPQASGGQRWFHLYAGQHLAAGDPLHWTGIEQNWNYQCADCHTTNLEKNYDAATRTYHTTWSELGVGCEACHGPGSAHAADPTAKLPVALDERRGVAWKIVPDRGIAERSLTLTSHREVEACAQCHARRGQFATAAGQSFRAAYRPALLERGLYHVDGQMRDEVYNYGSFVQSRMYARGVTCSDCHEPHRGTLRASGNALCAQCHASERFDTPAHHHHAAGSSGAQCAGCHMPTTTYMRIDARHDHGFRIPRPDLARELGTPDACARCHADRPAGWTERAFRSWVPHPHGGGEAFARAFASADAGEPGAPAALTRVLGDAALPAIVRASAARRMAHDLDTATVPTLDAALTDPDPLVRGAATGSLAGLPAADRASALAPRLADSDRIVRMEAALALAGEPETHLDPPDRGAFTRALDEALAAERFNTDRPEAQVNLGNLLGARGDAAAGQAAYREALALEPGYPPAVVNLADLQRALGDDAAAERVLREGIAHNRGDASLHHALGLTLARRQRLRAALDELALAARLDPAVARYAYVQAVALHDSGARADALRVLEAAVKQHPYDREILAALVTYQREAAQRR
jgi:predicted CXXCH cytochrome family protein